MASTIVLYTGEVIVAEAPLTRECISEGAKIAIASHDGRNFLVYNSIVDGYEHVWYEQITYQKWLARKRGK